MVPVFLPYKDDFQVDLDKIEPYAKFLKSRAVDAVLINSTAGEGMSLNVEERKKVAEKWSEVCKQLDLILMVHISGCSYPDVVELAKHAAKLNVDAVLCLPELYFKPKTVEKLVQYLKDISVYCPNIPLYYYHIPIFSDVDLPMASFMELAKKEIPSFTGVNYASGDLEKGIQCLKHGHVFLGSDTILCGGFALGFTSAIMTSLNLRPEICFKIVELVKEEKIVEARQQQLLLNEYLEQALRKGVHSGSPLKKAFNDEFEELNLGSTRKPL